MKFLKISLLVLLGAMVAASGFYFFRLYKNNIDQQLLIPSQDSFSELPIIDIQEMFYEEVNFFSAINEAAKDSPRLDIHSIIVPHHLLASKYIAKLINISSGREINTVVIIGPNHENIGINPIASVKAKWNTPLGIVNINSKLVGKFLADFEINSDQQVFVNEHSIGAILPFVKYYLPTADIVPIVFSSYATGEDAKKVSDWLNDNLPPESLVITSIDFSHYLTKDEADKKDEVTKQLVINNDIEGIIQLSNTDHVDSPVSLVTSLLYAQKNDLDIKILGHDNAFNLSIEKPVETTSYFAITFSQKPKISQTTLLFGGDVMLSRTVNQTMVEKQDFSWPFREIAEITSKADLAIVNLESPFIKSNDYYVPVGSFVFKTNPRVLSGLKLAGIDMVSLSNNHFGNQGQQGMTDTFEILDENNISYIGAGKNFFQSHQAKIIEINDIKFGFLGYAYPTNLHVATEKLAGIANMDINQAKQDISKLRGEVDVLIVVMHSGQEYVSSANQRQINFAHASIDAGADLVIGHHPHWVQEIENYNGKPIIYSLGNLVFDQMWSRQTQQGALAKVDFLDKELSTIEIIPIHIYNYGQPKVVDQDSEIKEILGQMKLKSAILDFSQK